MNKEGTVWFCWKPRLDALWPALTYLAGLGFLFASTRWFGETAAIVQLWMLSTLYLLLAGFHVLAVRRRGLPALGITDQNWPAAFGVGAVLGIMLGVAQLYRLVTAGQHLAAPMLDLPLLSVVLPLLLVVAGDEVLFRGWFRSELEPAFGLAPSLLISALAYALLPLALGRAAHAAVPLPWLPAGYMPPPLSGMLVLFLVALFLSGIYRLTGSLWSSAAANLIARFALLFAWAPTALAGSAPALTLATAAVLWIVAIAGIRRWVVQAREREAGPRLAGRR